jgi:porin
MDMLFPFPDESKTTVSAVSMTQFLSEWCAVIFGKLDTIDGDTNEFASKRGRDQFMNLNFVLNPISLMTAPYSGLGAGLIFLLPEERGTLSLVAIDADGQPDSSGFDDVFDGGTAYSAEFRLAVEVFGLPGHHLVAAGYSTKAMTLLDQDLRLLLLEYLQTGQATPKQTDGAWCVYYNFDQYLLVEEDDPTQGFGVFGRFGFADRDTNPIGRFYSLGLGGKGILPGRDRDTFGIGYYYLEGNDRVIDSLGAVVVGGKRPLALDDAQGLEIFYNFEITPWLHLTPDFQIIKPSIKAHDTAYVLGFRLRIDF